VSRHWKPEGKIVRLRPVGGRRKWTSASTYVSPSRKSDLSGTTIGVVLAAAACAGIAVGLGEIPVVPSASEAIQAGLPRPDGSRNDAVRASFSYCKWGGGTNCVVDGDTFYLNGDKVRIAGIDAPETHPPRCEYEAQLGEEATEKLHALLNSGAVRMTSIDRDRDVYGRLLRDVQVNGADVGEAMVSAGVAREYEGGRRPWC
jgi:endonuclease YncB( thermonuclease family)